MASAYNASQNVQVPQDATAASSQRFRSYEDYLRHLRVNVVFETIHLNSERGRWWSEHGWEDDLWLLRFLRNKEGVLTYRFEARIPFQKTSSKDDHNAVDHEVIKSAVECQELLQIFDPSVECQVIILAMGAQCSPAKVYRNILGLGLDLEPNVWGFPRASHVDYWRNANLDYSPHATPWCNTSQYISIGNHSMVVLDAVDQGRPRTVIMFVNNDIKRDRITAKDGKRHEIHPLGIPFSTMYPLPPPSLGNAIYDSSLVVPVLEDLETWALRRHLRTAYELSSASRAIDIAFIAFDGLIRLHLAIPSRNFPRYNARLNVFFLKHFLDEDNRTIPVDPESIWPQLRAEVDAHRSTINYMPEFVRRNIDTSDTDAQVLVQEVMSRFERYVKELEIAEAALKDHISIRSTQKSTKMAERSIEESKRVMNLTGLAFLFIPISLASSIFGMNVQQINETGHSITSFVLTAVVLLVAGFMLWGITATFGWYKHQIIPQKRANNRAMSPLDMIVEQPWHLFRWSFWRFCYRLIKLSMEGNNKRH